MSGRVNLPYNNSNEYRCILDFKFHLLSVLNYCILILLVIKTFLFYLRNSIILPLSNRYNCLVIYPRWSLMDILIYTDYKYLIVYRDHFLLKWVKLINIITNSVIYSSLIFMNLKGVSSVLVKYQMWIISALSIVLWAIIIHNWNNVYSVEKSNVLNLNEPNSLLLNSKMNSLKYILLDN